LRDSAGTMGEEAEEERIDFGKLAEMCKDPEYKDQPDDDPDHAQRELDELMPKVLKAPWVLFVLVGRAGGGKTVATANVFHKLGLIMIALTMGWQGCPVDTKKTRARFPYAAAAESRVVALGAYSMTRLTPGNGKGEPWAKAPTAGGNHCSSLEKPLTAAVFLAMVLAGVVAGVFDGNEYQVPWIEKVIQYAKETNGRVVFLVLEPTKEKCWKQFSRRQKKMHESGALKTTMDRKTWEKKCTDKEVQLGKLVKLGGAHVDMATTTSTSTYEYWMHSMVGAKM
jgi:hypothetical protein